MHLFQRIFAGSVLAIALLLWTGTAAADASGPDDFVVVVSAASPVRHLTRQQVADLFLGRTSQFPNSSRAAPVDQAEGSPLREGFNNLILERTAAQIRAHWAKIIFTGRGRPPQALDDGEAVKQRIASDLRAIGYIHRSQVDDRVTVVVVN